MFGFTDIWEMKVINSRSELDIIPADKNNYDMYVVGKFDQPHLICEQLLVSNETRNQQPARLDSRKKAGVDK